MNNFNNNIANNLTNPQLALTNQPQSPQNSIATTSSKHSNLAVNNTSLAARQIALKQQNKPSQEQLNQALFTACKNNELKQVAELLKNGANVDGHNQNEQDFTGLHYASIHNNTELVKLLLTAGANPNIGDYRFRTPLHVLVLTRNNNPEIITLLHQASKSINALAAQDQSGFTPLDYAEKYDLIDIVEIINSKLQLDKALLAAAINSVGDEILNILATGACITARTSASKKCMTALHLAVKHSNINAVRQLLMAGANPNTKDSAGDTPLHALVSCEGIGHKDKILELLIDAKADLNYTNNRHNTPLHLAVSNDAKVGNNTVVSYLINKGADVNVKNFDGNTPIHLAVTCGNSSMVELLITARADVNAKNNANQTILDYFFIKPNAKYFESVSLILNAGFNLQLEFINQQITLNKNLPLHPLLAKIIAFFIGKKLEGLRTNNSTFINISKFLTSNNTLYNIASTLTHRVGAKEQLARYTLYEISTLYKSQSTIDTYIFLAFAIRYTNLAIDDSNIKKIKELFIIDPKNFNPSLQATAAYKLYQLAKKAEINKASEFCIMYYRYFTALPSNTTTILDATIKTQLTNKQQVTQVNDIITTYFAGLSAANLAEIAKDLDSASLAAMLFNLQKHNLLTSLFSNS